jgi:pimeloyl-ACP methyl ester carboxylesterase/DNA-binding NarL/FixJ family response regulator
MTLPRTRYARSGGVSIAYQVVGNGSIDVVVVPGPFSNLDINWEEPGYARLLRRLSGFARVILFDRRGAGLSDRIDPAEPPSVEKRVDDLRTVMDAVGSGRAVLVGISDGAPMAILFATSFPARARALVLWGGYAHFHTSVMNREACGEYLRGIEANWGSGASLPRFAPERAKDPRFQSWWARLERHCASPSAAATLARMTSQIDVRGAIDKVSVPTLILHRREDVWAKFSGAQNIAQKIPGARLVELSGRDHLVFTGEIDRAVDEIEEFVTGVRPAPSHHRILTTILSARLIAPERLARQLGDGPWRLRLDQFRQAAANVMAKHGGEMVVTGTEDLCARFDGPARAVHCALALRDAAEALALKLAVGVHTGEVEIHDGGISGYAVHVTQRIARYAGVGEVLVSGVVNDLVSGSGLHFVKRPIERAEEGDERLRICSVMAEQHLEPMAERAAKSPDMNALTGREREVLSLIADGLANAAIADRLDLSEHTVKRHVANILLKLDLPTRTAAAAFVARHRSAG